MERRLKGAASCTPASSVSCFRAVALPPRAPAAVSASTSALAAAAAASAPCASSPRRRRDSRLGSRSAGWACHQWRRWAQAVAAAVGGRLQAGRWAGRRALAQTAACCLHSYKCFSLENLQSAKLMPARTHLDLALLGAWRLLAPRLQRDGPADLQDLK